MAIDADDLTAEVGTTSADADIVANCVAVAEALLTQYVGAAFAGIPVDIFDRAWLVVGVELFNQRKAPNGYVNQEYATPDGGTGEVAVRLSADPLRPAYPILSPWVDPVTFA